MHPARLFVLYQFMRGLAIGMTSTIYVPRLLQIQVTLSQVVLLNAFCCLSNFFLEIPTGMWADGKSRSWSVKVGLILIFVATSSYSLANNFMAALYCEVLCGISTAFTSGADKAWVTDALAKLNQSDDQLGRVFSNASVWYTLGMIGGGIASGFFGSLDLSLGLVASAAVWGINFLLCYFAMNDDGEPSQRVTEAVALKLSLNQLKLNSVLMWLVAALMLSGLLLPFNYYWTPFFAGRVGQRSLGYVWPLFYVSLACGGYCVRKVKDKTIFNFVYICVALLVAGLTLALSGVFSGYMVPISMIMLNEFMRGAMSPLIDLYTQRQIESSYRATFGSVQSFLSSVGFAFILFWVWFCTNSTNQNQALESTIINVWLVCGSLLAVGALILWQLRPAK